MRKMSNKREIKGCEEYFFPTPMPKPPRGPGDPPTHPHTLRKDSVCNIGAKTQIHGAKMQLYRAKIQICGDKIQIYSAKTSDTNR